MMGNFAILFCRICKLKKVFRTYHQSIADHARQFVRPDPVRTEVCNHHLQAELIDFFHIVSAHAPNSLVPRYLREITREGATSIRLPYITQWNMEND